MKAIVLRLISTGGGLVTFRCPVCRTQLTKQKYERALGILGEKEEQLRHQKANLQAKLTAARESARKAKAEGVRDERARTQRLLAGKENQISALRQQLKRLKKGTTPQTDGLEYEDRLCARLRAEFSTDRIVHHGKGGDILHEVLVKGKTAGIILYECKQCKRIQTDHVDQAARDKKNRQADFAILVTTGTRRGFTGLGRDGHVLLVSPLGVVALAHLLRAQILEMARASLSATQKQKVAEGALRYIVSPAFKAPLEDAIDRTQRAANLLRAEVRAHLIAWQSRWELYQAVDVDLTSISGNALRVVQGESPQPVEKVRVTRLPLPLRS